MERNQGLENGRSVRMDHIRQDWKNCYVDCSSNGSVNYHFDTDNIANYQIIKLEQTCIMMRHKTTRRIYKYIQIRPPEPNQSQSPSHQPQSQPQFQQPTPSPTHTPYPPEPMSPGYHTLITHTLSQIPTLPPQAQHHIIKPIHIQTGILYEAGYMSLAGQVQGMGKGEKCGFEEMEVVNTIQPVLGVLGALHRGGGVHGGLCCEGIVVDEMGEVKVYYPGIIQAAKPYYPQNNYKHPIPTLQPADDYRALALIILQLLGFQFPKQPTTTTTPPTTPTTTTSRTQQQLTILHFITKTQKYSHSFVFCLLCFLQKKGEFIEEAVGYLSGSGCWGKEKEKYKEKEREKDKQYPSDRYFEKISTGARIYYQTEIIDKIRKTQSKCIKRTTQKTQFTPPLIKHADHTPKKTLQITKKYHLAQDVQNKKQPQQKPEQRYNQKHPNPTPNPQQRKKRLTTNTNNQQALKKVSNGKGEPNTYTHTHPHTHTYTENTVGSSSPSIYRKFVLKDKDIRDTREREDFLRMAVTVKRMRTISKKKNG